MAFVFKSVAIAALRSVGPHRLHLIVGRLARLIALVQDHPGDVNSAIEGMLFQLVAMLDAWASTPGQVLVEVSPLIKSGHGGWERARVSECESVCVCGGGGMIVCACPI
jgi:hypothetical protein